MGYACPVCSTPQADGEHLANHLAITALLHGDDHEAWLDANVPDWSDRDPDGLAAAVTPRSEETDHEATSGGSIDAENAHVDAFRGMDRAGTAELDTETRRIIERAREMTERMQPTADDAAEGEREE